MSRPQSSEGDHPQANQAQNGFSVVPVVSTKVQENHPQKQIDGSVESQGLLLDHLGINLSPSEVQNLHSSPSDSTLNSMNGKGIINALNNNKVNSNINGFQSIKIESNGYGPRGSLV